MKKITIATILVLSVSLAAMATGPIVDPGYDAPSSVHATTYLELDYESAPLGPGSGGMIGDYSPKDSTISYDIIADAAPGTGESKSLQFSKYNEVGEPGQFGLYYQSGSKPTQAGYVIESVFKVTDMKSDEFKILNAWRMCADILARPSATPGMFNISLGGDSAQNFDLTLNEWHKIQGMRIDTTGENEWMRYWVDGVYWRDAGVGIDDYLYHDRVDIAFHHTASEGEIIVDRMSIYDPIPEPSILLIGLALLGLRRKK